MMPTKQLIYALQDHFTARARLVEAMTAIKCYTKGASYFYSCKDGWDNKKYVNLPIESEDILPILQKYIDNIDKDIIYSSIEANIDSEEDLIQCAKECKHDVADSGAYIDSVKSQLKKAYAHRVIVEGTAEDNVGDNNYQDKHYCIQISNSQFFEFWLIGRCKNTLMFGFNGVVDHE